MCVFKVILLLLSMIFFLQLQLCSDVTAPSKKKHSTRRKKSHSLKFGDSSEQN